MLWITAYTVRPEIAVELNCDLNPGILENYKEIYTFWLDHQNPLEPYFKSSYDRYLKANNQSAGILSYDQVVGQIIDYFKQNRTYNFHKIIRSLVV